MRAAEASEVNGQNHEAAGDGEVASQTSLNPPDASLGERLRMAREQRGWSSADVAGRLKLPASLIGRLESDDYRGLTQGVFLQGYLGSYARLVGVPVEQAASVAAAHTQAAPLVATGTISRSRYLFDRYSVSATYLVLTAIIVVPAVWLATHGGLEQNLARTTPLDPPPGIATAQQDVATATTDDVSASGKAGSEAVAAAAPTESAPSASPPATKPVEQTQAPVVASMTPFVSAPNSTPAPAAADAPSTPIDTGGAGAHTLSLKLSQQSWVEIIGADGRKLEYSMLAAGSEHSYRSDGPVSVRLGNAQGAVVRSDGNVIDLAPFQRGNVAHVKLFGENGNGASRVDQ